MSDLTVSGLYHYPVKSCAGNDLEQASLIETGLAYDRAWMVTDENYRFITQREEPLLALVQVELTDQYLRLFSDEENEILVPLDSKGVAKPAVIWDDKVQVIDEGNKASAWLSEFLSGSYRLVKMAPSHQRRLSAFFDPEQRGEVGFADGYPLLVVTEASLSHLNQQLPDPVPITRFRPNIVIAGGEPYQEDYWRRIKIGEVMARVVKPCARCVIIDTDQETGKRRAMVQKALAKYRTGVNQKGKRGIMFAQNAIHENLGEIRVNDPVAVIEQADQPNWH